MSDIYAYQFYNANTTARRARHSGGACEKINSFRTTRQLHARVTLTAYALHAMRRRPARYVTNVNEDECRVKATEQTRTYNIQRGEAVSTVCVIRLITCCTVCRCQALVHRRRSSLRIYPVSIITYHTP